MISLTISSPSRPQRRCCALAPRPLLRATRRPLIVRATKAPEEEEKKKIQAFEESLKQSGLDKERAQKVLQAWQETVGSAGGELTPEELRKVMVKQGAKFSGLALIQVFLDVGAAYGAFVGGNFLGEAVPQYGFGAVALQAIAYFLSGYYFIGAFLDLIRLGMVLTAIQQFNVNSAAFLTAVKDLAGPSPTGLATLDKAADAINTAKVLGALNKMAGLIKEQQQGGGASSDAMLKDLAAYLTLEKAQRLYGFEASKYGITDSQAADIATVFSAFDADDNGVLSLDEFQRLCARYTELSGDEVKAALAILDTNKDGSIQLGEFVEWWVGAQPPPKA